MNDDRGGAATIARVLISDEMAIRFRCWEFAAAQFLLFILQNKLWMKGSRTYLDFWFSCYVYLACIWGTPSLFIIFFKLPIEQNDQGADRIWVMRAGFYSKSFVSIRVADRNVFGNLTIPNCRMNHPIHDEQFQNNEIPGENWLIINISLFLFWLHRNFIIYYTKMGSQDISPFIKIS